MREELARTARNEAYDEQPLPQLNSEAIDFRAASELLAPWSRQSSEIHTAGICPLETLWGAVLGSSGVFERNVVLSIHVIEEDDGDIGGDRLDV